MKRWSVIVELPAQGDIAECRLWIAEHDIEAADRWFYDIYDAIATLEIFPERAPLAPENKFFENGNPRDFSRSPTEQIPDSFYRD